MGLTLGILANAYYQSEPPIDEIVWEMGINLSRVGNPTSDTVVNWNNVRPAQGAIPDGTSFSNLVDINNVNRNVTFAVSTNGADSNDWYTSATLPVDHIYPSKEVYYAAWFLLSGGTTTFILSGLDDSKKYSLRFLAEDSDFVAGQVVNRITIGSTVVNLDTSLGLPTTPDFDDPAYGSFDNIKSSSGNISFTVAPAGTENYWMMMGIRIREYSSSTPEPPEEKIVNVNISHVDRSDDSEIGWNTIRYPNSDNFNPEGIKFENLLDENGNNSGIALECTSSSNIGVSDVDDSEPYPSSIIYKVDLWSTPFIQSTFTLSGLNDNKVYDLRFIPNISQTSNRVIVNSVAQRNPSAYPTSTDFDDPNQMIFNDLVSVNGELQFILDGVMGEGDYWSFFALRIREREPDNPPTPESFRAVYNTDPENTTSWSYYEYLPENYPNKDNIPLLIYLTGSDEKGTGSPSDLTKILKWGPPKQGNAGTWNSDFITLSPQWLDNAETNYFNATLLEDFINYAKQKYKVDDNRIYLTGISAGGWYITYYLQERPSTHGIAAAIPISTTLENGYTTAAGVAASNCPQWWISNIGDPLVPWNSQQGDYIGVIPSVTGINSSVPGLVEKLTGFDNNTHEETWDGIYNSSLIGTADSNYDPFDESLYDWLLTHNLV